MDFTPREADPVFDALSPIAKGVGLSIVELTVSRHSVRKASSTTQVRIVVYKNGPIGLEDCSKFHRAALPRLELALPGEDLYVEVSSPGIDRVIKNGAEFPLYTGHGVRCYRTDISDWSEGILEAADEKGIVLKGKTETFTLAWGNIAKAKLFSKEE
jgi:ribosome maturation factor RimP